MKTISHEESAMYKKDTPQKTSLSQSDGNGRTGSEEGSKGQEDAANLFYPVIIVVNAVYILFRGVWGFRTFGRWQACGLAGTSMVYYVCYHGMLEAAKNGVVSGGYFDVFAVCVAGQLVSTFSPYGTYVYMLVPGYCMCVAVYSIFRKLRGWMRSQQEMNTISEEPSARDLKRQAKKEKGSKT